MTEPLAASTSSTDTGASTPCWSANAVSFSFMPDLNLLRMTGGILSIGKSRSATRAELGMGGGGWGDEDDEYSDDDDDDSDSDDSDAL